MSDKELWEKFERMSLNELLNYKKKLIKFRQSKGRTNLTGTYWGVKLYPKTLVCKSCKKEFGYDDYGDDKICPVCSLKGSRFL